MAERYVADIFGGRAGLCRTVWICTALTLAGCGGGSKTAATGSGRIASGDDSAALAAFSFRMPDIPAAMTGGQQRADYVAGHFWDGFQFADSTVCASGDAEQFLADYLACLLVASPEAAGASLRRLVDSTLAHKSTFWRLEGLLSKYLYEPNSPYRDEERYAVVVERVLASGLLEEYERTGFESALRDINKNRRGMLAADFAYTLVSGRTGRLHGIKTVYTLLYFYNPDCHDCARTRAVIEASPAIARLSNLGAITIMALYPDEDLAAWKAHTTEIPAGWINGYDATGRVKGELYDLRAIPSLYLLDRYKRVLLKDATAEQVEAALVEIVKGA